jgi:branched-chain amino acid transport system substrate-binding protein
VALQQWSRRSSSDRQRRGGRCSAASDPIRIGAVFSETGALASIGSPGLAGMRLAAAEINADGGVLGRRVQIVAADSRSKPEAVARAVETVIESKRVVALGGLNDSTLALAAGPVAQRAGIPFVTSGATLPTLPRRVEARSSWRRSGTTHRRMPSPT